MAKLPPRLAQQRKSGKSGEFERQVPKSESATIKLTVIWLLAAIATITIVGCIISTICNSPLTKDLWSFSSWIISGSISALLTLGSYELGRSSSNG